MSTRLDDVSDLLTVITVTHNASKDYGSLSPPSADLVEQTVGNVRDSLPGVADATHYLYYNYPVKDPDGTGEKYGENLQDAARSLGLEFRRHPNRGLRKTLVEAVRHVDTPYLLFLEHDWVFKKEIDLIDILDVMEQFDEINYIRFNKRPNRASGWDNFVEEDNSKPIPLCKVSTFSNNPNISRTEKYSEWIHQSSPSVANIYFALRRNEEVGGPGIWNIIEGVYGKLILNVPSVPIFDWIELAVDSRYKYKIEQQGFNEAHSEMGTYLYGPVDGGPYVEHLGPDDQ